MAEQTQKQKNDEKAKKKRDRELSDIREVVKTPAGRRFYWRLMAAGKPFDDVFCGEEVNRTNYRLGKQEVSRFFFNELINADPDSFTLMQREQGSFEKNEEIELEKIIESFDPLKPSV